MANRYFSSKKTGPKITFKLLRSKRKSILEKLNELENYDRGWYAGAVGWIDINKDYELDIGELNDIISDITLCHYNVFEDLYELHQD